MNREERRRIQKSLPREQRKRARKVTDQSPNPNGHLPDPASEGAKFTPEVMPHIVPTQFHLQQMRLNDGTLCVALMLFTPTGTHITFWPGDTAIGLGERLIEQGRAVNSGLFLPGQG